MQQHKQQKAAIALSALVALLAALALAGGSAYAAPHSGGTTLNVIQIDDRQITLRGAGWTTNEAITLNYSTNNDCQPSTPLDTSSSTIAWDDSDFTMTFTWPSNIEPGTYYLCSTGSETGGPVASLQTIAVNPNSSVNPTPGSTAPPTTTATNQTNATGTPGQQPTTTATNSGTTGNGNGGDSGPGNQGATASTSVSSLIAIILLCLLVLALLVYLIRIWLQGRQAGGPTP